MHLLYIFSLLVISGGMPTSFDACETRKPCEKITSEQVNVICLKMVSASHYERRRLWHSLLKKCNE